MRIPSGAQWFAYSALISAGFAGGAFATLVAQVPNASAAAIVPHAGPVPATAVSLFAPPPPVPRTADPPLRAARGVDPPPDVARIEESRALRALRALGPTAPRAGARVTIDDLDLDLDADPPPPRRAARRPHVATDTATSALSTREHPRMLRYVRHFSEDSQGRATLATWLKRSGLYRDLISKSLREHGLPVDLIAVAFVESGCSPNAVSSAGATGLWQFMPQTARAYGLNVESTYDERRSPWRATEAAASHLSDLYERYRSWELAMAAYNMGYSQLERAMTSAGVADYWDLADREDAIPRETALYVPKVLAVATILRDLAGFGFDDVVPLPAIDASALEVPAGTPLSVVARAAGTSLRHIRELNPEVRAMTMPDRSASVLHVPSAGLARAQTLLPRLLAGGEGRERVAAEFDWGREDRPAEGKSRLELTAPHGRRTSLFFSPPGVKRPDPATDERAPTAELDRGAPAERLDAGTPPAAAEEDADDAPPRRRGAHGRDTTKTVFYRVAPGDTLPSIAATFGLTPLGVLWQNGLDDLSLPVPGTLLRLSVKPENLPGAKKKKKASARDDSR